jgi:hypothetical protein
LSLHLLLLLPVLLEPTTNARVPHPSHALGEGWDVNLLLSALPLPLFYRRERGASAPRIGDKIKGLQPRAVAFVLVFPDLKPKPRYSDRKRRASALRIKPAPKGASSLPKAGVQPQAERPDLSPLLLSLLVSPHHNPQCYPIPHAPKDRSRRAQGLRHQAKDRSSTLRDRPRRSTPQRIIPHHPGHPASLPKVRRHLQPHRRLGPG